MKKTVRALFSLLLAGIVLYAAAAVGAAAEADPSAGLRAAPAKGTDAALHEALLACDGYAYSQNDGVKYWLETTDGLKLHCWFISDEPSHYEKVYTATMKKAMFADGTLHVSELLDAYGFPMHGLRELTLSFAKDSVTMTVDVDESKLAGGAGDNLLSGSYVFKPWDKPYTPPVRLTAAEPFGELILPYNGYACMDNGVIRCWLDTAEGIRLHCWFVSDEPAYYQTVYTLDPANASRHGAWITGNKLVDREGAALPGLRSLSLFFQEGSVLMFITRDKDSLAGGAGDDLSSGPYLFTPYIGSYIPPQISGKQPTVSDYDGYTCTVDGAVRFWLESDGSRLNLALHCFFPTDGARWEERVFHIDSDQAHFIGQELVLQDLLDDSGQSVFDGYTAFSFRFGEEKVMMHVERDEKASPAGEAVIPDGDYLFLPRLQVCP